MTYGNVGGPDVPAGKVGLREDMAEFDMLPRHVRLLMQEMSINWNASAVRQISRKHGDHIARIVLKKTEGDMQAAYRHRVGLA